MPSQRAQRNTRQRQVVLDELRGNRGHLSAAELYERARAQLPRISLGTVYRNLELLAQNGVIRKLQIDGAEARYDGDTARHYHVRCVECGRIDDVHELPDDFTRGQIRKLAGYDIVAFRLDFLGVCPECQGKSGLGGGVSSPQERNCVR
jgi:Fur family ferric uptake transcriptional regulator